jgi:hypothetical protein
MGRAKSYFSPDDEIAEEKSKEKKDIFRFADFGR